MHPITKAIFTTPVPQQDIGFVVPVEAIAGRVGPDYLRRLAQLDRGTFRRDLEGIGLMEDMGVLRGPLLDPKRLHPLIREFYEHTTRFELTVEPKWNRLFLPAFWLFRVLFAEEVGQFNLPFDV